MLSLGLSISYDDCLNRIVYLENLSEIINPNDNDTNLDYMTEMQFGQKSNDFNKKTTYGNKSKKRKSMFKTG